MERMEGKSLSSGLAKGVAVVVGYELQRTITLPDLDQPAPDQPESISRARVPVECDRMDDALERSQRDLQELKTIASDNSSVASAIELVSAHAAMAGEIASLVKDRISHDLVGVEEALDSVIVQTVSRLTKIDNDYLRERETDVRDIGQRMMRHLLGLTPTNLAELPSNAIIVARELVPSDAIALANSGLVGIVTQIGGNLGHTAIIARSLGIPAVSGIANVTQRITSGMTLLLDGEAGIITAEPSAEQLSNFDARIVEAERLTDASDTLNSGPCRTLDGIEITLLGNVGLSADLDQVLRRGMAGVGLFRTEFLYLQSTQRPDTEAQRRIFAPMAKRLGDRPLVIRTFDLGGDKLPPFLSLDENMDPSSLSLRGLRFSLAEKHLLRSQLTAIVQVAQEADVRILFPMVIGGHDFAQAISMVEEVVEECQAFKRPQIGAMIETPAALFCLDEILELADFVAIGTNDLTQYLLAADRELSAESELVTAMHPAVLRAIQQVVVAAKRWNCPVCVCGEEASDPEFAELLIGLGIQELSISPSRAGELATAIGKMNSATASALAQLAQKCRSPQEVRQLLTPESRQEQLEESDHQPVDAIGTRS
ncbi:Phosphoenolpyruvate-protein phosphotransferase of PTS system [Rhodopirellula islandica]|uniref:Phosphoenolpyruvate-protein phosphotransferase n=1 Tax=Rhodopirellula islandica TaxID=595434 RepID=A0A0J1BJM7_RHOIS|nr:phosphoenolpyruvate--protein phosphotransferase [Rhodopirellula islandica]KLU06722.1 Phosphoenolpyruvate-protein phosphotransferase of PTS system [Rhodopirellula islandica]